jgi:hypothetical protein
MFFVRQFFADIPARQKSGHPGRTVQLIAGILPAKKAAIPAALFN